MHGRSRWSGSPCARSAGGARRPPWPARPRGCKERDVGADVVIGVVARRRRPHERGQEHQRAQSHPGSILLPMRSSSQLGIVYVALGGVSVSGSAATARSARAGCSRACSSLAGAALFTRLRPAFYFALGWRRADRGDGVLALAHHPELALPTPPAASIAVGLYLVFRTALASPQFVPAPKQEGVHSVRRAAPPMRCSSRRRWRRPRRPARLRSASCASRAATRCSSPSSTGACG